jgi:hypothetical protein
MAGFALTWLLVVPPANPPSQPAAKLRVRVGKGDRSELAMDEAVARVVSQENLAETLAHSGMLAGAKSSVAHDAAEELRERIRVDIRVPDEAGVQEVLIRWAGDPREPLAGRLVKALSRQLAARLATKDPSAPQREYEAARSELSAAAAALTDIRAQFETALDALGRAQIDRRALASRQEDTSAEPTVGAPPNVAEADETQLLRQRLLEVEQRRQLLADRLTPEHPEMRALDEKIDELRSAIARRPETPKQRRPVVAVAREDRAGETPDEQAITRRRQLWQATLEAQNRYAAALAQERTCWRSLALARGHLVAEIESTRETGVSVEPAAWRRWLVSLSVALLCVGLIFAAWPRRRQTFASAEEVRAITRLPVVVVQSASLN